MLYWINYNRILILLNMKSCVFLNRIIKLLEYIKIRIRIRNGYKKVD